MSADFLMNPRQKKQKKSSSTSSSKMAFLNAHPVVRMVKSHETVQAKKSDQSSDQSSANLSESQFNSHLTATKWYHNFKNFTSNNTLNSAESNTSSVASPSFFTFDIHNSKGSKSPTKSPEIRTSSASNSPDWKTKFALFDLEKNATRTKSACSSSGSKLRIGLSLRKSETYQKIDKLASGKLSATSCNNSTKRKTGLETELMLLREFSKSLSGSPKPPDLANTGQVVEIYPEFVNFEVEENDLDRLRLVFGLELSFVADILVPKSKYLNRFAFRTLKRKTSKRGTRSDGCPRLSLATSTSAITDEQSFSVIHTDSTWRCVTSPSDEVSREFVAFSRILIF